MTQAGGVEEWRGRIWSFAEIVGLVEGASYSYQCSYAHGRARHVSEHVDPKEFGQLLQLRMPPLGVAGPESLEGRPVRMAILGDMAVGWSGPAVVQRILSGPPVDIAVHLGDLAGNLTDEDFRRGDSFLQMVQPLASSVPYMTLPGDRDDLRAYHRFFRMPSTPGTPWYSLTLGPARLFFLWTEPLATGGPIARRQLDWLAKALERADSAEERRRRPWLIVSGHRPLYCSLRQPTCGPEALRLRAALGPLMTRFRVDLYLSAHLHAYERTFPVANGSLCPGFRQDEAAVVGGSGTPCGPVYIVNGDAGTPSLEYESLPAHWTAQRHPGTPGHGELTLHNRTHLQYRQIEAAAGGATDEFWLLKPEKAEELPRKPEEENFLEAISWLAFATAAVTGTCTFIGWSHSDGLKRRDEALRHLRVELAVLSGVPSKILGTAREAENLVRHEADDRSASSGLH